MVHHDDHYRDQSPSRGNVNHEDENDFYDALVGRPRRTVDDMRGKVRTAVALGDNNDNTNNGHEDDDNDCNGNDDAESKTTFMQQYLGRIITSILAVAIVIVVFVLLPMYAVHAAKQSRWDHMLSDVWCICTYCCASQCPWHCSAFSQLLHATSTEICHPNTIHGTHIFNSIMVLIILPWCRILYTCLPGTVRGIRTIVIPVLHL